MFSGNDIDIGNTKIFVDMNTIENSNDTINYWLMNRNNSSLVRVVDNRGILINDSFSNINGIRAVIYLKSGLDALDFVSGEGTAQSPYVLS